MILDQARYDSFWRNPEAYRITYEVNLVPKELPFGLARGTALHRIADMTASGANPSQIDAALQANGIGGPALRNAWVLWNEFQRKYGSDASTVKLASEVEFAYPIPGSSHVMAGRIDEILQVGSEVWCGELKTANERAQFQRVRNEWEQKKQADFVILGARHLGYDVKGVLVRVLVEGTPPKIWPFNVTRSEHQLNVTRLHVHMTCEIIEFLRRTFGTRLPWPHVPLNWPCNTPGKCELEHICCQDSALWTPEDLEPFKPREEHLNLLKKAA